MTALEIEIAPEIAHGTRLAYVRCSAGRNGGKCEPCTGANAAYVAIRRRSPKGYIPAGKARTHLRDLLCLRPAGAGMSLHEIERRSGITRKRLRDIFGGLVANCTPETENRILGVFAAGGGANHISVVPDDDGPPEDPLAAFRLLLEDPEALAWKAEGECARLDIEVVHRQRWFFPKRGASAAQGLAICARCPVWRDCLGFALATNETEGIWGRTAGSHRRKIVHHGITVDELGLVGMDDDPSLGVLDAIDRVLVARDEAAS